MNKDNCWGKQSVNFNNFVDTVVCVGIFIFMISAFLCVVSTIRSGVSDASLFYAHCLIFGTVLAVEGLITLFVTSDLK